MRTSGTVAPLVLAAGASRRFGSDKLLALLEGRPVLAHVLEALRVAAAAGSIGDGVGIAPDARGAVARLLAAAGLEVVTPPPGPRGLGASLRAGVQALERQRGAAAALVVLADQPRLSAATITALVATWGSGACAVVRPVYAGEPGAPGHPVLLDRSVWPLATRAEGDIGLRELFASSGTPVHELAIDGSNPDVDTPADLAALATESERCATS